MFNYIVKVNLFKVTERGYRFSDQLRLWYDSK